MKHATLRQLKVFETVARLSSFSRAAEELHLTQPAVSTQVKQLEQHAGLPLFEQLGKKIYLTPAGSEMLHYSRAIIARLGGWKGYPSERPPGPITMHHGWIRFQHYAEAWRLLGDV